MKTDIEKENAPSEPNSVAGGGCAPLPGSVCWESHARKLAAALADAAGYLASVRTDRILRTDGDKFALQTLDWAEGAKEYADSANEILDEHDALVSQNAQSHPQEERK